MCKQVSRFTSSRRECVLLTLATENSGEMFCLNSVMYSTRFRFIVYNTYMTACVVIRFSSPGACTCIGYFDVQCCRLYFGFMSVRCCQCGRSHSLNWFTIVYPLAHAPCYSRTLNSHPLYLSLSLFLSLSILLTLTRTHTRDLILFLSISTD